MERDEAISKLVSYALHTGLIQPCETTWAVNTVLDALKLDSFAGPEPRDEAVELAPVLEALLDDAHRGGCWRRTPWCTGTCSTPSSWAGSPPGPPR